MKKQNDPHPNDKVPTGAIRRFFNALGRWLELMDHGPFDYTLDRIGQLEGRVFELERAWNATIELPPKSLEAGANASRH